MNRMCKWVVGIYAGLAVLSLALVAFNAAGLAGEPDPLSGVFAMLLATPWPAIFGGLASETGEFANYALVAGELALNVLILFIICRLLSGSRTS